MTSLLRRSGAGYLFAYGSAGAAIGLLLFALTWFAISHAAHTEFRESAMAVREALRLRLAAAEELASGIAAHMQTVERPDAAGFRTYTVDQLRRQPWVSEAYYAPLIGPEERDVFVRRAREEGFVMFDVHDPVTGTPSGTGRTAPIRYLEPLTPHSAARLGADLLSIPRVALGSERAVVSGDVVLVPLGTEQLGGGFLLMHAQYAGQELPDSERMRRSRAIGLAAIRIPRERLANGLAAAPINAAIAPAGTRDAGFSLLGGGSAVLPVGQTAHALAVTVTEPAPLRLPGGIQLLAAAAASVAVFLLSLLLGDAHRRRDERALALRQSEQRLRAVFGQSFQFTALLEPDGTVLQSNRAAIDRVAGGDAMVAGGRLWDAQWLDGQAPGRLRAAVAAAAAGRTQRLELECGAGATVLDCFVQPLHDEGQDVELVVVEMRDITELRSTARQLAAERDQAAATLDALTNALVRVDRAGRIAYVNPAAAALLDRGAEELCGQPAERVIDLDCMSEHPVTRVLRTGAGVQSAQGVPLRRHDGSGAIVEYAAFPVLGPSSGATVPQCILVLNDVTQAHELTERIAYQARHDSLTGLFNRREFERRLKRCFEQARHEGAKHTLVYIDLDQFKLVNDTCGHVVGDRLLRQVSRWIRAALRENQILARIGGDEFGLLVLHSDLESGARTAERILAALQEYRFRWNRRVFQVGASMGVVPVEASAGTVEHVLAAADSACFAAKELGRNRIKVFRPDDDLLARREREMHCVPRVTEAIRNDGLCLYCQPIARADGQPGQRFHEILVRMTEPDGRVVSPDQFLPAAERFGLITDLDAWVVGEVIAHIEQVEGTVSVNLSGHSLARPSFMADVHRLVRDGVADPRQLVFEITETAVMADMDASLRAMEKLRELGCGFALDDFGTGLSSFGYLKQLPVDYVKIDGLFVQDLVTEAFDRSIVGSIAQMTRILGKRSIAEKVEDPDMIPTLHAMGVDFVQGYACGMPQPWSAVRNGSKDPETLSAAPRGRAF